MQKGIRLTPELFKNVKKFGVELEKYAKKSGGIDKDDFMKVAAIAKKGMLPDKSDIPSDTDPRDKVLSMMAGIVGDEILLAFKGLSPSIDNYIKKTMKEDEDLEKIAKELEGASKKHLGQSKRIKKHLDKMKEEVELTETPSPNLDKCN